MSEIDQATQSQLNNIQKKTGKSLAEIGALVAKSGLVKHGELRTFLMNELGIGYGDANALVHVLRRSDGTRQAEGKSHDEVLAEIYSGSKAPLRPIHEAVMKEIHLFGTFEIVPKKGYLSLRRKKQFAMLGPATNSRVELGLNVKDLPASPRLLTQPQGSMCTYIVRLTAPEEVDGEVIAWARQAFEAGG